MTFILRRVNNQSGALFEVEAATDCEWRQRVAWCAIDNLGMYRSSAYAVAAAAEVGVPFDVGHYTFTVERTS